MNNKREQDKKNTPLFATPAKNKPLVVKTNIRAGEDKRKN